MKKKMFIWLDDERPIRADIPKGIGYPEICDILMCKTAEHCIEWLEKHANEYRIWIENIVETMRHYGYETIKSLGDIYYG